MGTENKMGVAFDTEVFGPEGRGHYTVWNDDGVMAKIDASAMDLNAAAVFVGGRHGIWLEKQGSQACHEFAIDRVAEVFGNGIRKHVIRSITTAWSTDPRTRGSWAYAMPGQACQREKLARPIEDSLFFSGEATSLGGQGTCHGNYLPGIRAARELAHQINSYS
jgi:monoamine oxidase